MQGVAGLKRQTRRRGKEVVAVVVKVVVVKKGVNFKWLICFRVVVQIAYAA